MHSKLSQLRESEQMESSLGGHRMSTLFPLYLQDPASCLANGRVGSSKTMLNGWMDGQINEWTERKKLSFLKLEGYRAVASPRSTSGCKCDHQNVDVLGKEWEAGGQSQGSLAHTSPILSSSLLKSSIQ